MQVKRRRAKKDSSHRRGGGRLALSKRFLAEEKKMNEEICPICQDCLRSGACWRCGYERSADFLTSRTLTPVSPESALERWTWRARAELLTRKEAGEFSDELLNDLQRLIKKPAFGSFVAVDAPAPQTWICRCGYRNPAGRKYCENCDIPNSRAISLGANKKQPPNQRQEFGATKQTWTCFCGYINDANHRYCRNCDLPKR